MQVAPTINRRNESGRGQPHSKTLRKEWHAGKRASVLECGCPLPLLQASKLFKSARVQWFLFVGFLLFAFSVSAQTRVKLSSIKPGTEQVQLIPNGDFQFQGTPVGTNYPSPTGWSRSGDLYAIAGPNKV